MDEQPLRLSPDEETEELTIGHAETEDDDHLYWAASVMVGMITLLVGLSALAHAPEWVRLSWLIKLNAALLPAIIAYMVLTTTRPRLHRLSLCVVAAVLGMLYNLPASVLTPSAWVKFDEVIGTLAAWFVVAAVAGVLVGRGFDVERRPLQVIAASFLFMFVLTGLAGLVGLSRVPLP